MTGSTRPADGRTRPSNTTHSPATGCWSRSRSRTGWVVTGNRVGNDGRWTDTSSTATTCRCRGTGQRRLRCSWPGSRASSSFGSATGRSSRVITSSRSSSGAGPSGGPSSTRYRSTSSGGAVATVAVARGTDYSCEGYSGRVRHGGSCGSLRVGVSTGGVSGGAGGTGGEGTSAPGSWVGGLPGSRSNTASSVRYSHTVGNSNTDGAADRTRDAGCTGRSSGRSERWSTRSSPSTAGPSRFTVLARNGKTIGSRSGPAGCCSTRTTCGRRSRRRDCATPGNR